MEVILYPEIESRYIQNFNVGLRSDIEGFIRLTEGQNLREIVFHGLQRFAVRYPDESSDRKQELKRNLI